MDVTEELPGPSVGTSYRARRYGTDYALTVFDPDRRDQTATLPALRRAAARLAEIAHPRLPTIYEVGEIDDRPYLVTELVTGRPLADLIAGDPLPVAQAMRLILDVAEPLAAMHRQGLVHGDLSSAKLMVTADGTARLLDVGLGSGTLGYLAPEQTEALARPVDNRTDLYTLGVVLYESLTGTLPFLAADSTPDPRTQTADLPESLALLVTTLLARDPGDRYQSGEELASDLRLLLGESLPDVERTDPDDARPLFGRARELDLINELREQVHRGHGRGIALRGVSGVGKTRLLQEVLHSARQDGTPVLLLACRPNDPEPFSPLRRAVEHLILDGDLMPVRQRNVLFAQVREAAGTAGALLAALSPALGELLGSTPLPDADRHDQFAAAVGRFITELARLSGGLLLVTDDADLIDPSTLRVMSHLAAGISDVPLLSIGSFRTDRRVLAQGDPLLPAIRAATDLDLVLEPLEPAAVDQVLLDRLPGIDLDSDLARRLRGHGDGNPFVLLEHLHAIIDVGLVQPHWGSWRLDDEAREQLQLPDDPLGLIMAGVEALAPTTRRTLVVAAVIGMRFEPLEIAKIGGLDPVETFSALAEATRRRLVELTDEGDYRFRHERIRDALNQDIDPDTATELHQSIAEVLSGGFATGDRRSAAKTYAIAQHYLLGTPSRSAEQGYERCRDAGRLALRGHAPGRAAVFLEHAAQLRPGDARLLYTLGTALHRDGRFEAARQRLEEALVVERDGLRRARILLRLTEVHRATRNTPKAVRAIEWGLAELDAALPDGTPLRALGAIRAGLVAFLISITGWGFGTARSRDRERQDLLASLHLLGGHLGGANLRPANLIMHRLYGVRAAVRLGSGSAFTRSYAALGLTAARYGWGRLQRRCLARAEKSAADLADPQLVAEIAWYAGAADYLARVDNGERWIQCLTDHGAWLNSEQYSDTVSAVCWDAAVQGRDEDVLRWAEYGRARRAFGGAAELTSLLTVPAIGLTAAGRAAAANAELRRVRDVLEQHGGRSLQVSLVLAELYALLEQDHLGEHFDAVAERFFDFKLPITGMLRQHQSFFVLHAQGRLAQYRLEQYRLEQSVAAQSVVAQPSTTAPAASVAARMAVRQLGAVANTPLLKAAYQQSRAELLTLEGHPKQALNVLSRLKPQREDAPILGFEIARTTARALLAAGYPADARRQILSAVNLAEDHGWTGRRQRLATEFGLRTVAADEEPPSRAVTVVAAANAAAAASAANVPVPDGVPVVPDGVPVVPARGVNRELDLAATLRDTLVEMSSSADPMEILRQLVTAAQRVLPEGQAWLIRPASRAFGSGTGILAEVLFSDLPAPGSVRDLVFDPDLRAITSAGRPIVGDPDSVVPPQLRRLLADSASWLLLPLVSEATPVGLLVLASAQPQAYADTEIAVAGALAAQGMAAHAKASLIARLQELTGTDELTGVRSLRQVLELATRDLQGARHSSRPLVVMLIGIDGLGRVNDLHGRSAGDDVVRQVASRLGQVIRDTDLLGRYHEDEFIVVLSQGRDGETGIGDGGLEVAERLLSTVSQQAVPTRVGPLPITVTIGLTLMTKDDSDITGLTARAETALHAAKQGGRNQVRGA